MDDIDDLLAAARSGEPDRQLAAVGALAEAHARAAVPDLVRLAADSGTDAGVRVLAVDALASFGADADRAGPALLAALGATDELVRSEAADGLGRLGYQPAGDALARALAADPSPLVRVSAAESLGDLANSVHLDPVLAASADDDEAVRAYAAASAGLLGAAEAALRRWAEAEPSPWVRAELAAAAYRTTARPADLAELLALLDPAGEELATRLLNTLDDLVTRQPVTPADADLAAITTALNRTTDRHPLLRGHAETLASRWTERTAGAS
ncbi:MAG: HEAT repeat domain-containing protein [Catenulispora sp.]